MPIYIIKCEDCKCLSEMLVKFSQVDENNNVTENICPHCGKEKLTKLPSLEGGSFQLKGKWFKTTGDY